MCAINIRKKKGYIILYLYAMIQKNVTKPFSFIIFNKTEIDIFIYLITIFTAKIEEQSENY